MTPGRHQSAEGETDETGVPQPAVSLGVQSAAEDSPVAAPRRDRRPSLALRNWRVRSKLLAILLIPLLVLLGFAGLRVRDVLDSAQQAHRAAEMARLNQRVVPLARALATERDQSAWFIGSNRLDAMDALKSARDQTDRLLAGLISVDGGLSRTDLGAQVTDRLGAVRRHADTLSSLRQGVDTDNSWFAVDAQYRSFIDDLLGLQSDITQGSDDPDLNAGVRGLAAISQYVKALEVERGDIGYALAAGTVSSSARTDIFRHVAEATVAKSTVDTTLTPAQGAVLDQKVTGPMISAVDQLLNNKILSSTGDQPISLDVGTWYSTTGRLLTALAAVQDTVTSQVVSRAQQLGDQARRQAIINVTVVLAVLLLTILLALLTVRSLVRPLRRLRARALEVAYTDLPHAVARMRDTHQTDAGRAAPIGLGITSRDEVGEVADAFDTVHREAVRHAAEQTQLRQNISIMFVNLSRRTQSLVERQLRLIDHLEGTEQDPDSLENLFQLDHLATRMRRNAENLLVLAGSDPGRRWNHPVALIDVLRAAAAEVEQYQRVVHTFVIGREIEGRAVGDIVHLVAELLENASEFSPPETHVVVSARSMSGSTGVIVEIEDHGIGMSAADLTTANARLAPNAEFEPQASRIMGLYVVGRLAARHGIRVQLRTASAGGVTALIQVPPEVVVDPMTHTEGEPPEVTPEAISPAGQTPILADPAHGLAASGRPVRPSSVQTLEQGRADADQPDALGSDPQAPDSQPTGVPAAGPPPLPRRAPGGDGGPGIADSGLSEPAEASSGGPADSPADGPDVSPADNPTETVPVPQPNGQVMEATTAPQPAIVLAEPAEAAEAAEAAEPSEPAECAPAPVPETDPEVGPSFDLDETIVPHDKDEDLPIFAELESRWFLRRDAEPLLPPPPSLPLKQWGMSPAETEPTPTPEQPEPSVTGANGEQPAAQHSLAEQPDTGHAAAASTTADSTGADSTRQQVPAESTPWVSPADAGWQAAQRLAGPADTGGIPSTTSAGLPIRVPMAHFVPGAIPAPQPTPTTSIPDQPAPPAGPPRSPDAVRGMLTNFQRGLRQGREAGRHRRQPDHDESPYANQEQA